MLSLGERKTDPAAGKLFYFYFGIKPPRKRCFARAAARTVTGSRARMYRKLPTLAVLSSRACHPLWRQLQYLGVTCQRGIACTYSYLGRYISRGALFTTGHGAFVVPKAPGWVARASRLLRHRVPEHEGGTRHAGRLGKSIDAHTYYGVGGTKKFVPSLNPLLPGLRDEF